MNQFYFLGRALQMIGLVVMPSAILAAEGLHNEALCIGVFVGAGVVFLIGYFITSASKKI